MEDVEKRRSLGGAGDVEACSALVANFPEGIALLDRALRVTASNGAYLEIFGGVGGESPSLFSFDWIHEEDHPTVRAALSELLAAPKASCLLEFRIRQGGGSWIWLEANCSNMLDTPAVHALAVGIRDITQRKLQELHLHRMSNILLESQKVSHFGSFEYVAATHETIWSEEEYRIYGIDPACGSPPYEQMLEHHIHRDDAALLDQTFREAFAKKGVYELEHRIVRPDGTVRVVHDIAHPYFDDDGNLYKYIGTTHDVTERRELEAQLLQVQKMESIGQLAGGIAHDFNNLLIPIMGYAELAKAVSPPAGERDEHLEQVIQAAKRAAGLTQQILAFSRKQILQPRVDDLNEIILEFEAMTRRIIGEDIELRTFLEPNLYRVSVDRGQVEQILLNLVVNARDALPRGGRLTFETSNVYLDEAYLSKHKGAQASGHYAMLAISDSGCGMDAATQKRIFEPFFTTKTPGLGTGLGLATVFGIVSQHRGSIWVYSELDKGTTFKIYLPRADGAVQVLETVRSEIVNRSTGTILVVEDEDMVRRIVCETLEATGYRVLEARGPDEAIRLMTTSSVPIDLLLTDVVMPGMNGRQLHQQLEAIQSKLPVLYTSGYTDNVIVHHGVLDAGLHFLQKPFTLQALREKVRQSLA
jgi:two-component system, cell cycle sensor histidine kinase and response regulator CckA